MTNSVAGAAASDRVGGLRRDVWLALLATAGLILFLAGQRSLDRGFPLDALVMLVPGAAVWLLVLRDVTPAAAADPTPAVPGPPLDRRRRRALRAGVGLVVLTVLLGPLIFGADGGGFALLAYPDGPGSGTNTVTTAGLLLWLAGVALYLWSVVERGSFARQRQRVWDGRALHLSLGATALAVIAITVLAAYFRFVDLAGLPAEMTSDHVEKLLDINSLLHGLRPVYLPNNGGREPLEFYLAAGLIGLGFPLDFMTLKLLMGVVSTLTIPLVYLLGRQVSGPAVGLFGAFILALAPWHVQITRIGLRIAFSPLFAALTLALLFWALSNGRRNAWLATGLSLGLGLYGYAGFRPMLLAVPLVVVVKLSHDAWHSRTAGRSRPELPAGLTGHLAAAVGLLALVASPFARYALDQPAAFWERTMTRMTSSEQPLEHPFLQQLWINWTNGLMMVNRTSDNAWLHSPAGRPALETVGGALFLLGVVVALFRTTRGHWREGTLVLVIPVLLLSSVMALAFPIEVPHLSRAAVALPAVVVLAALPLPILIERWRQAWGDRGTAVALVIVLLLALLMGRNTWQRYLGEYRTNYDLHSFPTSAGGAVARGFLDLGGDADHIYNVGWQNGWDYRALGLEMGRPEWNGQLWGSADDGSDAVRSADAHTGDSARKLYFVGGQFSDQNIAHLQQLYPLAIITHHPMAIEGKDFWTVLVPARTQEPLPDGG